MVPCFLPCQSGFLTKYKESPYAKDLIFDDVLDQISVSSDKLINIEKNLIKTIIIIDKRKAME